ncbi:MAG: hypothetical protein WCO84_06520 [bacterium]
MSDEQVITFCVKNKNIGDAMMDLLFELTDVSSASIRPSDYGREDKFRPMCFAENEDGITCQGMVDLGERSETVVYDTCMECKYFGKKEYHRIIGNKEEW